MQYRIHKQNSLQQLLHFKDVIQMTTLCFPIIMDWITVLLLINRYFTLHSKIKRRLFKPHLLLRILAGYCANEYTKDVWQNLQTNWTHFFWLTGETPRTLKCMVQSLERYYYPYTNRGRKTLLDFKNQVHIQIQI